MMSTISAAVIAGGFSHRMGRDKALLPDREHGTLLQRQLHVLRMLEPLELLVSCRPGQALPVPSDARSVFDDGSLGPLAGVTALLEEARGNLVLLLGVDLGRMTSDMLSTILTAAETTRGIGVVPWTMHGPEPLASLLPRTLAPLARARLESSRDLSLHGLVDTACAHGAVRRLDIAETDLACFANWNELSDLPRTTD